MAEVDTLMLAGQHSDIRREAAEHTNEIVKEALKETFNIRGDVKDGFYSVGRDTQDIRAQVVAQQQQMVAGFAGVAKDAEINALKTQIEIAKQTTYLSDKIDDQHEKTRELISDLKFSDLNRELVERNATLVEAEADRRYWRHNADNSQWAVLQSQVQAFASQLQETRQGMVNFGTMSGQSGQQTSTSNNVR